MKLFTLNKTDNPIPWCLLHSYMAHTLYMECVSPWIIFHLNKTKQKNSNKICSKFRNQRVNHLGKVLKSISSDLLLDIFPFAPPDPLYILTKHCALRRLIMTSTNGLLCPLSVECGQIKSIAKRSESETIKLISFPVLVPPSTVGCLSTELSICHEVALKGTRLPIFNSSDTQILPSCLYFGLVRLLSS